MQKGRKTARNNTEPKLDYHASPDSVRFSSLPATSPRVRAYSASHVSAKPSGFGDKDNIRFWLTPCGSAQCARLRNDSISAGYVWRPGTVDRTESLGV